jgi:hypothetical protein
MALCIRISTYLYDKKTIKLRIRDFREKLQEDQYFGDCKIDGKKELIKSADLVRLQPKRSPVSQKQLLGSIQTRPHWK